MINGMAARYAINLLKVFAYYLILFALCRLAFLVYFSSEILPEGWTIFFRSLGHALPLDVSAACYLLFIPLLVWPGVYLLQSRGLMQFIKAYLVFTSLVIITLSVCEIAVYREMHVKVYFNLLSHLSHPAELFRSVSFGLLFTVLALVAMLVWVSVALINGLVKYEEGKSKHKPVDIAGLLVVLLLTAGLLVIGGRGGLQPIPINEGEVYFSQNQCVNDATVNPLWNIVHSYIENRVVLKGEAYKAMPDDEAEAIVKQLYSSNEDSTIAIFKTQRPNICFLILESWSADVVASLGGYEGLTPEFDKLAKEGCLFTNIKPAGHVSDQGIPAILSGYPALPIGSAINQPERHVNLPCLNNELKAVGYNSSFYFGGQLIYGNIKAYIYRNGFLKVVEQQDLPSSIPAGRLGIHDSIMLSIWQGAISQMQQPFFTCLFTVSTHSPFDIPASPTINWGGKERPYLNSVAYSDRQIGLFFNRVRTQSWYDSTVFVLVADHSHNTPKNYPYCSPDFYHIPLLICGGALKEEYRGRRMDGLGSQTDIAATLLYQLQLSDTAYRWSKNLLNPSTQPFGFYTFDEGFGYVEDNRHVVWNKKYPQMSENTATGVAQKDSLQKKGAAILQVLMKDFLLK